MDFLIRLFRTLAFERRLQVVQLVFQQPGITLHQVQSELCMPEPDASKHMKLLSAHGVIDSRPSGKYLLASPAIPAKTSHVLLKRVRLLLEKLLKEDTLVEAAQAVCPGVDDADWSDVLNAMCFELTAYTHLRRLLIIRMVSKQRQADLLTIMGLIGMSHSAARRHTDKLIRRGVLCAARTGNRHLVQIPANFTTPFRGSLFAAVRDHLAGS